MGAVDTNVLLRWLLRDVPEQADAAEALIRGGRSLRVDDAALIEVVYVLQTVMGSSRGAIARALDVLIAQASLDLDRPLWSEIARTYVTHSKLSVVDIYLALRTRDNGTTPLYTLDRKLASQLPEASLLGS